MKWNPFLQDWVDRDEYYGSVYNTLSEDFPIEKSEKVLNKKLTIKRIFDICNFYSIRNVDLANLFDTTEVAISNWKSEKKFPTWDKIIYFAYLVGIPRVIIKSCGLHKEE